MCERRCDTAVVYPSKRLGNNCVFFSSDVLEVQRCIPNSETFVRVLGINPHT